MIEHEYIDRLGESENEYLVRLGRLKESKAININWEQLTDVLNENFSQDCPHSESYWRKKYHRLVDLDEYNQENYVRDEGMSKLLADIEKQRVRISDERTSYNKLIRSQARCDSIVDLFKAEIKKYDKPQIAEHRPYHHGEHIHCVNKKKAIHALLSDIHYGISYDSVGGKYNSRIAGKRLLEYAEKIAKIGAECDECYLSLMGDLVSGAIHQTIRLENKETVIEQVIGVSEAISAFIYYLSERFENVYVNSVDGNHSRLDPNLENTLRGEKLDALVPWYCKTKLDNVPNVIFIENEIDSTIASFEIMGKLHVSVHGDMEKDLKTSATNIEKLIGRHVDCMCAAHLHVAEYRCEDTLYVRNGCVCGSGDDYTMKRRLFSPPTQVCMICTPDGVESIHPVVLKGE